MKREKKTNSPNVVEAQENYWKHIALKSYVKIQHVMLQCSPAAGVSVMRERQERLSNDFVVCALCDSNEGNQ